MKIDEKRVVFEQVKEAIHTSNVESNVDVTYYEDSAAEERKMKIDYTQYLKDNKKLSTMNIDEKRVVFEQIKEAIHASNVTGNVDVTYYEDSALVVVDGVFYGVWSYEDKHFFSGSVGDYRPLSERD